MLLQATHPTSSCSLHQLFHTAHLFPASYLLQKGFEEKMEMGMMEVEDDVFFADLNRQISLLINDDEDDGFGYSPPISSYPTAVSIQAFTRTSSIYPSARPQYQFDQISSYMATSDQSKGTGVFIPKSSQWSRRRNKHQNKTTTTTTNNNNYNSYNNSFYKSYRQQLPSQAVFAQVISPKKC